MVHNQIITYGLTDEEVIGLQKVKPNKDCSIVNTDCATDIIAIGAYESKAFVCWFVPVIPLTKESWTSTKTAIH
jgi:hypothetical protein